MTDTQRDRPLGQTSGSEQRPARRLEAPVLTFDLAEELRTLKEESSYQRGDRNARTLMDGHGFRVVLTALKAGTNVREHRTAAWASIQTTAGHLRLHMPEETVDLPLGHVAILEENVPHGVEALDEGAFLLTVATSR